MPRRRGGQLLTDMKASGEAGQTIRYAQGREAYPVVAWCDYGGDARRPWCQPRSVLPVAAASGNTRA